METAMKKPQRSSTIDEAAQRARQHVSLHSRDSKDVEIYKLRGRIGEELAQEEIDGANLNDLTGKSNFANYDIVSSEYLSSVKVKGLMEDGLPRYSDYNKYFTDIVNPNSKANQQAAKDLLLAVDNNPEIAAQLPPQVANASTQETMQQALADNSILQIPYDQVPLVRDNIYSRIVNSPSNYGLSGGLSQPALENQARNLVENRIQPICEGQYSSHEMGQAAEGVYQQGHSVGSISENTSTLASPTTQNQVSDEDYYYSYGQ
jgi:hypothetical protein